MAIGQNFRVPAEVGIIRQNIVEDKSSRFGVFVDIQHLCGAVERACDRPALRASLAIRIHPVVAVVEHRETKFARGGLGCE